MWRAFKLEWQTLTEKKAWLKVVLYQAAVLAVFIMIRGGDPDQSLTFFPSLMIVLPLLTFMALGLSDPARPMQRLLPSLPYRRSNLFWARSLLKFVMWLGCLVVAVFASWLLDSLLDSWPSGISWWIGISLSLLVFGLEHWTIHMKVGWAAALQGGLTGAIWGGLLGTGGSALIAITNWEKGLIYGVAAPLAISLGLLLANLAYYERKAL